MRLSALCVAGVLSALFVFPILGYAAEEDISMYVYQVERDDASFVSLQKNIENIDVVISERLYLTPRGLEETDPENAERTQNYLKQHPDAQVFAHVHNFNDAEERDGGLVKRVLSSPDEKERLINDLVAYISTHDLDGLSVDFENLDAKTWQLMVPFLDALRSRMHVRNPKSVLVVNVPLIDEESVEESDVPFAAVLDSVDKMIIMSYDQHWADSEAGPVSGMPWYLSGLDRLLAVLDPKKVIVALGNYGYDRVTATNRGTTVTWQEALTKAASSDGGIAYDAGSLSPTFAYTTPGGVSHTVRYLDATTFSVQALAAKQREITEFALWRLGSEDPHLRTFVAGHPSSYMPTSREKNLLTTFASTAQHLSRDNMLSVLLQVAGYRWVMFDARSILFIDDIVSRMLALYYR